MTLGSVHTPQLGILASNKKPNLTKHSVYIFIYVFVLAVQYLMCANTSSAEVGRNIDYGNQYRPLCYYYFE